MATRRAGVTVVELLVVLSIVALVAALALPAVQSARESSRRSQCLANLRQVGLAMQGYVDAQRVFPPSSSFQSAILPQLELSNIYRLIDYSAYVWQPENAAARGVRIALFHCPDDGAGSGLPGTNYAGNFGSGVQAYGYNGIIRHLSGFPLIGENRRAVYAVAPAQVVDGLSNTAAVSEILIALDYPAPGRGVWYATPLVAASQLDAFADECDRMSGPAPPGALRGTSWLLRDQSQTGYNHVLAPNRNCCFNGGNTQFSAFTANSLHPGGVNLLRADAHAGFVSEGIERPVWRALGSRSGGEMLSYEGG